jgi:hypothetical protein
VQSPFPKAGLLTIKETGTFSKSQVKRTVKQMSDRARHLVLLEALRHAGA